MTVYFQTNSLRELEPAQVSHALAEGCQELKVLIRDLPDGSIIVGSTNEIGGWTGVYRKDADRCLPFRVARYRDFSRTLSYAQRIALI
jgi:hypothetical protein